MSRLALPRPGILQRLTYRVAPRSLQSQGINLANARPVYDKGQRRWLDRAIYVLLCADLVVTASFCELTWNNWTMRADTPTDASLSPAMSEDGEKNTTSPPSPHYVLRPTWQRASLVTYTLLGGVGIAFLLFTRRASSVRRLYIIPDPASSKSTSRLVVIQSHLHSDLVGTAWPLKRAKLLVSPRGLHELRITLNERRAQYLLGLNEVEVVGQKRPLAEAKKLLFQQWYGDKKGTQLLVQTARIS